MPKLTRTEAAALAREVLTGKSRSLVQAALALAEYLEATAENERHGAWFREVFANRVSALSPIKPSPNGPPLVGSRLYIFNDTHRDKLRPHLLPPHGTVLSAEPDPFPPPSTAPRAKRHPEEHALMLPTVYRTNRPPAPEDLRAMRPSPIPAIADSAPPESTPLLNHPATCNCVCADHGEHEDDCVLLIPMARLVTDRPDPYLRMTSPTVPPSSRRSTPKSRASVVPHPSDSSGSRVFDRESPEPSPPHPRERHYCGTCDHEYCTCVVPT